MKELHEVFFNCAHIYHSPTFDYGYRIYYFKCVLCGKVVKITEETVKIGGADEIERILRGV